jgi:predicted nucleic acid-binding protein
MNAEVMLDTNVVVYAASALPEDAVKQARALDLIDTASFGLSAQVLQEFYVTATRKLRHPLSHAAALEWLETLCNFPCIPTDAGLVLDAVDRAQSHRISYWDAAIIVAAERLGATTLYSEDLNDGQTYGSVTVVNPFRSAGAAP